MPNLRISPYQEQGKYTTKWQNWDKKKEVKKNQERSEKTKCAGLFKALLLKPAQQPRLNVLLPSPVTDDCGISSNTLPALPNPHPIR